MAAERRTARRFVLKGRVQGVGFRWWTRKTAAALGLGGWVRNRRDGAVEVVAEGAEGELGTFADRLREGPGGARVDGVEEEPAEPEGDGTFQIRF